jgi:tetratricopeptide (TPR) repeat protein
VFSKEHAILVPLAAIPLYIVVARPAPRRLAAVSVATLAVAAAAGLVLWMKHGEILGTPFDEFSRVYLAQLGALNRDAQANAFGLSILNESWLFLEYGVRWLLPYAGWMSINLRPPFPLTWWSFPHVLGVAGYLAVLVGGFVLLLRYRDWRALVGLALTMPALLFLTEFATVWVQDPFVLYRSYLWAIGIPGLVFCLVHGPAPRVVLAVGLVAGALLVWQALDRVLSLDTPESAWSDAIVKLPNDPRAVGRWFPYLNRGSAYVDREQFALAVADFENSSALGDMGMGAFNLGAVLASEGKHPQALAQFDRAEKQGYDLFNLPFQRGLSLLATGKPQEAYAQFALARAKQPPSPTRELVYLHLGRTAFQLGRIDDAVSAFEQLVQVDPRHKEGRYLLGLSYVRRGQFAPAREVLTPLLAEGENGPAAYARALANHGLGRKEEALADIGRALRLDPNNPHLREWEARIRSMPGPR